MVRLGHRKTRDKARRRSRSSDNLGLDIGGTNTLESGLIESYERDTSPAALERSASTPEGGGMMPQILLDARAAMQEDALRGTSALSSSDLLRSRKDTDYARAEQQGTELVRAASVPEQDGQSFRLDASDALISGLEAKAAALVTVGGAVKGLDLEFEDLALSLANGTRLLNGVTGSLRSGRLCAIMGPSGAGKTTFLYTLCGKATYGEASGTLRINGEESSVGDYRPSFGFVPQEDVMLRMMTVQEICHFYASMRLPPHFSSLQKSQCAETVIDVLGMSHIRDSKIGDEETRGVSGGQRKRVNIAMELVAKPSVLFL